MKTSTLKRLFAVSGNTCAFPGCTNRLVVGGDIVGEVCHIRARSSGGPRYESSYPDVDAFENVIAMCPEHHTIVDKNPLVYPTEMLEDLKRRHEDRFEQPSDDEIGRLTININEGSFVTSYSQKGGQTAHQITNIYNEPPKSKLPTLMPIINSRMTHADNGVRIDYYDFRVRLRNEGDTTANEFRLEVDVPRKYASSPTISAAEVPCPHKPDMKCYRRTSNPGLQLYPGGETDDLSLDYLLSHDQYQDVHEEIAIRVYVGDELLQQQTFSIRDHRHKDRMDQLGLKD